METCGEETMSPINALQLVQSFFDKEWATTGPGEVSWRKVTGGLINTLHLLTRTTASDVEPSAVLVRHFGLEGNHEEAIGDNISLSAAQQAIVYWEMCRRGWGPRIYGLFPGGRVEEYVDSHTLTAAEAAQSNIMRDVARSYARLHSLELPLRRNNFELIAQEFKDKLRDKSRQVLQILADVNDDRATQYAALFKKTDWTGELEWVFELLARQDCKVTVIHGDANYLNILVKHSSSDCQIMLIDYETISYSYRGVDIGGHFNERMYCYNQPHTQLTGFEAHTTEEQRHFCEAYLEELLRLGQRLTRADTVEHLMLEAEIGRMYQLLFTNLMCMVYDEPEEDPLFLSGLEHMLQNYYKLKEDFVTNHPA